MYHVLLTFQCVYGCSDERGENGDEEMGVRFLEEGREQRLQGFLYTDDLVLFSELEEDLRAMVRHLASESVEAIIS